MEVKNILVSFLNKLNSLAYRNSQLNIDTRKISRAKLEVTSYLYKDSQGRKTIKEQDFVLG